MTNALEAVRDRRPMSTNIFDLKRAEAAGFVVGRITVGVYQWSLTPEGEAELAARAAR